MTRHAPSAATPLESIIEVGISGLVDTLEAAMPGGPPLEGGGDSDAPSTEDRS